MKKTSLDMNRCTYLHIVVLDSGNSFCSQMVELLMREDCHTDIAAHLFVTNNPGFFDRWHGICRVILVEDIVEGINTYGRAADYIILHGICWRARHTLRINMHLDKKIIWRTWGHDITLPQPQPGNMILTVKIYLIFRLLQWRARRFACIGCANIVDVIKVKKAFGEDMPLCIFPYPTGSGDMAARNRCLAEMLRRRGTRRKTMRIMVGHSGFSADKHFEILQALLPLKDSGATICLPLVYGEPDYMEAVSQKAQSLFGSQCEILRNRMPFDEYAAYINDMDLAIMASENSTALGNIDLLVYFEKKIYLSKTGDICAGFAACGLPYDTTNRLPEETADEIFSPLVYSKEARERYCAAYLDDDYLANCFKRIFDRFV